MDNDFQDLVWSLPQKQSCCFFNVWALEFSLDPNPFIHEDTLTLCQPSSNMDEFFSKLSVTMTSEANLLVFTF